MPEEKSKCPFCAIIEDYAPANVKYEDAYVIGLESDASQAGRVLLQEILFLPKSHQKICSLYGEHELFEAIDTFLVHHKICDYELVWSTGQHLEGHSFVVVRFPFNCDLQSITR